MVRADVCYLVTETPGTHGLFDTPESAERMVYCAVRSVSSVEFWRAYEAGVAPTIVFDLAAPEEYRGERLIRHGDGDNAKYYRVIRTYDNGKTLEITCEEALAYDGRPESGA